eukprot:3683726-Pleurochrysis_carterae.AAC.1
MPVHPAPRGAMHACPSARACVGRECRACERACVHAQLELRRHRVGAPRQGWAVRTVAGARGVPGVHRVRARPRALTVRQGGTRWRMEGRGVAFSHAIPLVGGG